MRFCYLELLWALKSWMHSETFMDVHYSTKMLYRLVPRFSYAALPIVFYSLKFSFHKQLNSLESMYTKELAWIDWSFYYMVQFSALLRQTPPVYLLKTKWSTSILCGI